MRTWLDTSPTGKNYTYSEKTPTGSTALPEALDIGDRLSTFRGVLSFRNQYLRLSQSRVVWLLPGPGGLQCPSRGLSRVTQRAWRRHRRARGVVVLYRERTRDDVHRDDDRDPRARVGDLLCDAYA